MEGGEIIISVQDLANHLVYSRKKSENEFQLNFLLRRGGKEEDLHIKALRSQIAQVEERLAPIEKKLNMVDLITLTPNRAKIEGINKEIASYKQEEIEKAMYEKQGELYALLRERAVLTKKNYENREDIARLTLLANSLPREEGEAVKRMVEGEGECSIELGSADADARMSLLLLLNRVGVGAAINETKLEKGSTYEGEVARAYSSDKKVWLPKEKLAEFDSNEKEIEKLNNKVQRLNAIKQVRELDEGESAEWAEAQKRYIEALAKRRQFISESSRGLSQLKLRAQARIDEVMREIESKRPAVGESAQIKQEVKEALAEMLEGKKPAEEEKK